RRPSTSGTGRVPGRRGDAACGTWTPPNPTCVSLDPPSGGRQGALARAHTPPPGGHTRPCTKTTWLEGQPMATTIGVFESRDKAERAVRKLRDAGFSDKEVSLVARGEDNGGQGRGDMEAGDEGFTGGENIREGVSWGGGIGALGGLLASAGMLAIPGIGPIIAAGPLAAALSGAVAGGLAGGLLDMGIPEEKGKQYEEEVKQGRVLCVVEAESERSREAAQIMREAGAMRVRSGMLAIPGIGPIIAAGPLAAALSGAVAGGLAGGLLDMGIPEEKGKQYEEEVKQGRVLCVVEAESERSREAAQIMREAGAMRVETHG